MKKNDAITLSYDRLKELESRFGTPSYLFDEDAFTKNFDDITSAFSRRYDKFILAYSYKTNYIPYLCKIIRSKGGYAEVVSRLEYDLAMKLGQEPAKIILNGPVKNYEDIELALNNQSIVNLDSRYEVEYVLKYAAANRARPVRVGLRINIDLTDESGRSHLQEGISAGRFGFAAEDVERVVAELAGARNVVINSLHGHSSTRDRSVWCYEKIAKTLCETASQVAADTIEYIDVGGGIYGYLPPELRTTQTPSFNAYAEAVCGVLNDSSWARRRKPRLVLEPGVAMVANTMSFVTKVVSVKTITGKTLVTVDGSAFHTKPTFHKMNPPYTVFSGAAGGKPGVYSVAGATCMEKDYLLTDVKGVLPQRDDYIKIDSVGAYTVVLSPAFIHPAPPILVLRGGQFKEIRRRQTFRDMFGCYSFD